MNIDPGLLAAIIANPADDLPRLQMSDWLDERGECERAEFIRVQCELARRPVVAVLEPGYWLRTPDRHVPNLTGQTMYLDGDLVDLAPLQARERELLGHPNCEEWTRQVFPNPNGGFYLYGVQGTTIINHLAMRFQFTRGFVSAITCTAHDWLRHADHITAATPLERVTWTTWPTLFDERGRPTLYVIPDGMKRLWPHITFTTPPAADYPNADRELRSEIIRGVGVPAHLLTSPTSPISSLRPPHRSAIEPRPTS